MAGIHLERERFCCSVCSNLLNNPVTVPCGHCFCMSCVNYHLDQEDHVGIYSCPQCREIFVQRPLLVKNTMVAIVVAQLKEVGEVQAPGKPKGIKVLPPVQPKKPFVQAPVEVRQPFAQAPVFANDCYAGPEDVACDVCSDRKFKAVKSCLQCLVSYCGKHLQPHNEVARFRMHKLVEATADLEESICPQHQEVMKMFCRTDQRCICYLCSKDGHKGHDKISIEAERLERQKELQTVRQRIQLRIQEREKDLSCFQQEEEAINQFADNALINTEKVFTELIYTIEKKLSHIKESLQSRQNSEMGRFTTVRDKVEKEIDDLNRKDAELDKLSRTENHINFVVNYSSLSRLDDRNYQPTYRFRRQRNFEKVTVAVAEAKNNLHKVLNDEYEKILHAINGTQGLPSVAPAEQEATVPKTNGEPVQTTDEFLRSRILQNLTSPTLNDFQNRDDIMQGRADFEDLQLFEPTWQNFSPVRATPEFKRQNFSPTGASPEINGETFFLSRIPPKRHSRNFSAVSANASFQSPQLAAPIATPRRLRRELSQPENDDFGQNGFIRINKNFDQNSNHLVRSVSQFSLNNLEIVKPSPEELLARASSKVKLNNFQTRANLLKYAQQVSFDPHTANPHLAITNEKRQVVFVGEELAYPYNPERFAYSWQVLSKESLSGRCYLEVERSGKGVMVALCYKSISRAGTFSECMFGQNNKSWALDCFKNSCEFKHNNVKTPIPGIWSSRVGVYLDHRAGVLSFYSVSETMTLLHRVQTSFTEPLHVGLWVSDGATAKVCKLP
ncbi:E3 ubiquitin-protein ligase TRIM47 [Kryptolebias marmoratus]|uniref:E3 ubiquitin-protein ligase TRIM47 n=1 Tax=Kryptolebias marmoratus TaxID=37003 RepID=UPI0007F8AA16|nr:E3 ubiquitin-protein ligase TRIM47 [Kryptolebias marmoratus]